jgi:ABC-type nitrate/sulfonate/bicarbonate transport system permease component
MAGGQGKGSSWGAVGFGFATLVAVTLVVEVMLRIGLLNRYIVPLPSEVLESFPRIIVEEHIPARFLTTFMECLYAMLLVTVVGVLTGMLLYRFTALRAATETWVAAIASAPIVLMYPLFLVVFGRSTTTIVMMGFIAGLPPVILKTWRGSPDAPGARQCRSQPQRRPLADVLQDPVSGCPAHRLRRPSARPHLLPDQHRRRRVPDQLRGLGQVINDRAERYDLAGTYAAIGFVILTSVLFFIVTEWIERWLRPQT